MTVWLRRIVALSSLVATTGACSGSSPTAPTPVNTQPGPPVAGPAPPTAPEPAPAPPPTPGPGTTVTSVPWSQLPVLSEKAKAYIIEHHLRLIYRNAPEGTVKRWGTGAPIKVHHVASVSREDVRAAIDFWHSQVFKGKLTLQIVEKAEEANITIDNVWPPPNSPDIRACAVGGVSKYEGGVATGGVIHLAGCANLARTIAHELGHVLGPIGGGSSFGHTEGGDVMSVVFPELRTTPFLNEVFLWLYSVPPGIVPE